MTTGGIEVAVLHAMLKYYRGPSAYGPLKSALLTWLYNVARYNALSILRRTAGWLSSKA